MSQPRDPSAPPPGPRLATPALLRYVRDPLGFYARLARRHGRFFSLPLPRRLGGRLWVTGEPGGAREVFSAPLSAFGEAFGASSLLGTVGPGSLLVLSGERVVAADRVEGREGARKLGAAMVPLEGAHDPCERRSARPIAEAIRRASSPTIEEST